MNDTTEETFPPADPKAEFERQCGELDERRDFVALPGIDFAMHPDDLWFTDDVSDDRYFNEQFIEPRMEGEIAFLARMMAGCWIVMPVVIILVLAPLFGEIKSVMDWFWGALGCVPFVLIGFFWLWAGGKSYFLWLVF